MSDPHIFDELSSRLNRNVNSTAPKDLKSHDDGKKSFQDLTSSKQQLNEHVDGKKPEKKKGVIKSLKSFFSKKKKKKSHSDQALNIDSEVKKEDLVNVKKVDDDAIVLKNESPEKRNSLEKTHQKIRSSLRKLKIRNSKSDDNQKQEDSLPEMVSSVEKIPILESNSSHLNVVAQSTPAAKKPSIALKPRSAQSTSPIDIDGFSTTSTVQSSAAKDKIRIAPQNRRKPTRFQSDLDKKSPDEVFNKAEHNLDRDTKVEVSKKLFDSVSNTSICNVDGPESFEHSSIATKNVVRSESVESPKKVGISVEDIVRTRRTLSTSSRESIPLVSVKPRSRPGSINSMNNEEQVSHSRSLGALNKVTENKVYSNKDGSRAKSERTLNMVNETKENQFSEEQKVLKKPSDSLASYVSDRNSLFLRELAKDIRSSNSESNNQKTIQNGSKNDDLTKDKMLSNSNNDVLIKQDFVKKRNSMNVSIDEDHAKRNTGSYTAPFKEDLEKRNSGISSVSSKDDLGKRNSGNFSIASKDHLGKRNSGSFSIPSKDDLGKRKSGNYSAPSKDDIGKRNSGNCSVPSKDDPGKRNSGNYKQDFLTKSSCVDSAKPFKKDDDSNKNYFLNESKEKEEFDLHSIKRETVSIDQKDPRFKEDVSIIHSRNRCNDAGFQLASPSDTSDFSFKSKQSHPLSKDHNLEFSNNPIKLTDGINERPSALKKKPSSENINEKLSGKSSFPLNEIHSTSKFDWTSNSIKSEQEKKQKPLKSNESHKEAIIPEFNRISLKQTPNSKDLLRNSELSNEVSNDLNDTNNDIDNNASREVQTIEKSTNLNSSFSEKQKQAKNTDIDKSEASVDLNIVRSKSLSSAAVIRPKLKENSRDAKSTSWFAVENKVEQENKGQFAIKDYNATSMEPSPSSELQNKSSFKMKISSKATMNSSLTTSSTVPAEINSMTLPQHKNSSSITKSDKCLICDKPAYKYERCDIDFCVIHNTCAKCDSCSRKLNVSNIHLLNNKIYCSQHKPV